MVQGFCDCLQVQISAYLDNVFDVAALMEDSETKTAALEKVAELEEELGHVSSVLTFFTLFQVSFYFITSHQGALMVKCSLLSEP